MLDGTELSVCTGKISCQAFSMKMTVLAESAEVGFAESAEVGLVESAEVGLAESAEVPSNG